MIVQQVMFHHHYQLQLQNHQLLTKIFVYQKKKATLTNKSSNESPTTRVKHVRQEPVGSCKIPIHSGSSTPTGNFSTISRWFLTGSCRKLTGIHRKKIQQISGWNTASTSGYFRCFPAGSGDFLASFLQDPAGSERGNHWLGLVVKQQHLVVIQQPNTTLMLNVITWAILIQKNIK